MGAGFGRCELESSSPCFSLTSTPYLFFRTLLGGLFLITDFDHAHQNAVHTYDADQSRTNMN